MKRGFRTAFAVIFAVLFAYPSLGALQTDPTEIGDILTNTSEKTLVIALGPSNQRAEWKNDGDYYTLYSALPEVWKVTLSGLPAFTFSNSVNVNISMWVRPDPFDENGYTLFRSQVGEQIHDYGELSYGDFPFEMQVINFTSDIGNNVINYQNAWVRPSPAENYTYAANVSMFMSTQHTVEHVLIRYSPNISVNVPKETSPKHRLKWTRVLPGAELILNDPINWSFPGNNSIYTQVRSFGSMPTTDNDVWVPTAEILGGPLNDTGLIAFREMIRVQNESGVMFWPMGRGNWGYNSTLTDDNWLNQTAISNQSWKEGLSAIRAPNYTRLLIFDHIGLADIVGGNNISSALVPEIANFHSKLRNVSAEAGFTNVIIVNVVDPLIPATTSDKIQDLASVKQQAAGNDTGTSYFIDLAKLLSNDTASSYAPQPASWVADTRHSTYLGTVEIMKLLWKELTTYYGTDGIIYWETSSRKVTNKTIDSQTLLFNNTDTRERPVRLYNLTDTLIYFQNGSVVCSNISACMGNVNYTLNAGNYTYVLDNFNLTEGETRDNSPVSFISSSTTQKDINSTLNSSINMTVVASVSSCDISSVSLDGANPSYSCENSKITINITQIDAGNNILSISYPAAAAAATNDPGGGTPAEWRGTFAEDKVELSALGSITKNFGVKYRVKFRVHNETHHVGILNLTEKSVIIEVASTSQKAELFVGDEERFELNGDEFYDIKVRLNKINQDRAEISVFYIQEEVEKEKEIDFSDEETSSYEIAIVAGAIIVVVIGVFVWVIARRLKK